MQEQVRYYTLDDHPDRLVRVEGGATASVFRDGKWRPAEHLARKVSGVGGDSDFEDITEAAARKRFPDAFK